MLHIFTFINLVYAFFGADAIAGPREEWIRSCAIVPQGEVQKIERCARALPAGYREMYEPTNMDLARCSIYSGVFNQANCPDGSVGMMLVSNREQLVNAIATAAIEIPESSVTAAVDPTLSGPRSLDESHAKNLSASELRVQAELLRLKNARTAVQHCLDENNRIIQQIPIAGASTAVSPNLAKDRALAEREKSYTSRVAGKMQSRTDQLIPIKEDLNRTQQRTNNQVSGYQSGLVGALAGMAPTNRNSNPAAPIPGVAAQPFESSRIDHKEEDPNLTSKGLALENYNFSEDKDSPLVGASVESPGSISSEQRRNELKAKLTKKINDIAKKNTSPLGESGDLKNIDSKSSRIEGGFVTKGNMNTYKSGQQKKTSFGTAHAPVDSAMQGMLKSLLDERMDPGGAWRSTASDRLSGITDAESESLFVRVSSCLGQRSLGGAQ